MNYFKLFEEFDNIINIDENGIIIKPGDIRYAKYIPIWRDYKGKVYIFKKKYYITKNGIIKNEDGTLKAIHYNQTKRPYVCIGKNLFSLYYLIAVTWGNYRKLIDNTNIIKDEDIYYDLINLNRGIYPENIKQVDRNVGRQIGPKKYKETIDILKKYKNYYINLYKKEYNITDKIIDNIVDRYVNYKLKLDNLVSEFKLPKTTIINILKEKNVYQAKSKLDSVNTQEFLNNLRQFKSLVKLAKIYNTSSMSVKRRIDKEIKNNNFTLEEYEFIKNSQKSL